MPCGPPAAQSRRKNKGQVWSEGLGRGYEREILVTRKNKGSEGKRRSIYREGFGRASKLRRCRVQLASHVRAGRNLAIQVNKGPVLTAHTDGPDGVLLLVVAVGGPGSCLGKAVCDADVVRAVVAGLQGAAAGTGHSWSCAEICYGGQILMNEGVDLLASTLVDQPPSPHHHITVSVLSPRNP